MIADIAGKGMAAALLMANLQANLLSQSATASERPEMFLHCVNRLFYQNTDEGAYATLFLASTTMQSSACIMPTAAISRGW